MPTTSNFGWTTPADTDLVKDGAAAIRTLGNGIDTSLVDLKGGTTGQILSKASNTDLDYTWITNDVGDITAVTAGTGLTGGGTTGAVTLSVDSTVATLTGTQTLSNKTLTAPKFASAGEVDDANGAELIKFPATVASAVNEITISNAATTLKPTISATGDDTNITLNLVSKGTGTVQANGVDLVSTTNTQTLTNKTIALGSNTVSGTTAQFNTALTDGDFATIAGTETLTNKTLTSPVLTTPTISTIDAKGDLLAGTADNTIARLAVGANDTVLTADSSTATGLKWAAPAGGGSLKFIKRGTFSNVANTGTTFDDVFSGTYVSYLLNFEFVSAATLTDDLIFNLRTTGPATRTTNYKSASGSLAFGSTTSTYFGAASDDFWQLTTRTYGGGYLWFNRTNNQLQGFYYSEANNEFYNLQLSNGGGGGCIGFQLKSSSSNITGQVTVYGLAQA